MEGVDLRICPVDQLLSEVAPFHHQHVHLQHDIFYYTSTRSIIFKDYILDSLKLLKFDSVLLVISKTKCSKCFEPYIVLTREEAFLKAQQLHMPDVGLLHAEIHKTDGVQLR